jgi:hypothetical protein
MSALLSAGIIFVGFRFLLFPYSGAHTFGLPIANPVDLPWVWTNGTRDIVLGIILATILVMKQRRIAGVLVCISILLPVTDTWIVIRTTGLNPTHLLIHGGTAIYMAINAYLLLRS